MGYNKEDETSMGSNELALCWKDHHGVLFNVFEKLLAKKSLVDCTLAAEGKFLKAHRIVLSACSPYFEILLNQESDKHPILFLKDVHFEDLKTLIEFVYSGEIRIPEDRLVEFLNLAEALQIKGLGGAGNELPGKEALDELTSGKSNSRSSPVSRKRFRRSSNSESSSEATESVVESKKRIQQNVDHEVQAEAPCVPSPSCKRTVVSDEQNLDVSKVKVEVSNSSAHLSEAINSEQLLSESVISKSSEEILGLKTEFEQVTLPENYSGDMLLEENDDVETVINQDQPSSSQQFSGFKTNTSDPLFTDSEAIYDQRPSFAGRMKPGAGTGTNATSTLNRNNSHAAKKIQCSLCPKWFTNGTVALKHMHSHSQSPVKQFACTYCPSSFSVASNLRQHIRIHTGENKFQCVQCQKTFARLENLNYHLRSHNDVRPFQCYICQRAFHKKQHMQNHLKTHSK